MNCSVYASEAFVGWQATAKEVDNKVDEFVAAFAKAGVVFTPEEIDIVFGFYTQKLYNLIGELTDENGD